MYFLYTREKDWARQSDHWIATVLFLSNSKELYPVISNKRQSGDQNVVTHPPKVIIQEHRKRTLILVAVCANLEEFSCCVKSYKTIDPLPSDMS